MTAAAALWASAASAEVLLFSSNTKEQDFTTSSSPSTVFVDLNGSGGTKLSFTTTAPNQRVSIIFNASCIITSTDPLTSPDAGFIVINVLVDPAGSVGEFAAPPANALFCTVSNAHDSKNGERGVVVASARPAQAGTNTVRVQARLVSFFAGSTLTFTLQTVSLTVTR